MLLKLCIFSALFAICAALNPNITLSVLLHNATETKTTTETPEQTEVNEFWTFLNLIKRRLLLGYKVAITKFQNNRTVDDPKREQTILNAVVEKAKTYNLSEEWSRKFFQDQMDANKYVQREFIEKWKSGNETAPTEEVKLETVRKLIDTLNTELFAACVATETIRSSMNCTDHVESQKAIIVTLLNSDPIYTQAMEMALKNACLTHKTESDHNETLTLKRNL